MCSFDIDQYLSSQPPLCFCVPPIPHRTTLFLEPFCQIFVLYVSYSYHVVIRLTTISLRLQTSHLIRSSYRGSVQLAEAFQSRILPIP